MGLAEHAAILEERSGHKLSEFAYSDEGFRGMADLRRLEKLRGVQEPGLRSLCWGLYWICEAKHGAHPEQPTETPEWDGSWTTGEELVEQNRVAARLGLTRDGVSGLLSAEWAGFETRLAKWVSRMFQESGVAVSDAQKAQHRRLFHTKLRKLYGRSEAPARAPE